jgi:hypothetical protein
MPKLSTIACGKGGRPHAICERQLVLKLRSVKPTVPRVIRYSIDPDLGDAASCGPVQPDRPVQVAQ